MLDQIKADLEEALEHHRLWVARDPFKKRLEVYTFSFYDAATGSVYFTPKKTFSISTKVFTIKQLRQAIQHKLFYPAVIQGGKSRAADL